MTHSLRRMLSTTAAVLAILSASPAFAHGPGGGQQYPMGPGMMGPGMMGPGMMGPGMMGYGWWPQSTPASRDLSTDDVRQVFEQRLAWQGNKRLKVGEVKEADKDTITAEIVTVDGSLVERLKIDRLSGRMKQVE